MIILVVLLRNKCVLVLDYFYFDQGAIIHEGGFAGLKSAVVWFALIMALLAFTTACFVYYASNKILGACDRILRELDDVVAGRRREPLKVRKGDKMFQDILDRVNVLIERLPDQTG